MKINIKQIFSKNEDKHKIYHLSEFLIEKIFLTYLVIFVLITSLQLIIEYHSEKNNVKKTLNTFIDSNLQEIDKAIFSNDKLLLNHILEQISNKNEVTQIILIDTNNKKQFSWICSTKYKFKYRFSNHCFRNSFDGTCKLSKKAIWIFKRRYSLCHGFFSKS